MTIGETMLSEFDYEMGLTRKTLERVPTHKGAWKPHEKSFPLGHLAQLVSRLPSWLTLTIERTELDLNPPDGKKQFAGYSLETTETLLKEFDDYVVKARAAIAKVSDKDMMVPWSLKVGGKTVVQMPRVAMLRNTMNHLIHHRAQLTVYFRLIDVPVPALYGPSADERTF